MKTEIFFEWLLWVTESSRPEQYGEEGFGQAWWRTSVIPALETLRQEAGHEFKASCATLWAQDEPEAHSETVSPNTKKKKEFWGQI